MDQGTVVENLPTVPEMPPHAEILWQERILVDPMLPYLYDGCSNIHFPIHTSRKFATEVGLPGIIVQGTAILAHAVRELTNREAQGQSFRLRTLYVRFPRMVFPGTEVCIQLRGAVNQCSGKELHFSVLNHRGEQALSHGYAFVETA